MHTLVITAVSTWQVLQLAKARRPCSWLWKLGIPQNSDLSENDSRWSSMIHEISESRFRQSHESHERHESHVFTLKDFETFWNDVAGAAPSGKGRLSRWVLKLAEKSEMMRQDAAGHCRMLVGDGPFQNGQNRPSKFRRQARRPRALLSDRRQLPHLCRAQCSTARCYCNLL